MLASSGIAGISPFLQSDYAEIASAVQRGLVINEEVFSGISSDGKAFIQQLLQRTMKNRLSAEQCSSHPWIRHGLASKLAASTPNHLQRVAKRLNDYIADRTADTQYEHRTLRSMSALTQSNVSLTSISSHEDPNYAMIGMYHS